MTLQKIKTKIIDYLMPFAKMYDSEIEVECGLYSQSFIDEKIITFGLFSSIEKNVVDDFHQEYYQNIFPKTDISYQTITFLHELGHIITNPSQKKLNDYYKQVGFIQDSISDINNIDKEILIKYFTLELEKVADNWAFETIKNNYEVIKRLDKNIIEIVKEIEKLID